jgi:tagatose 1,6-diphosphate aldolase GatY/KbaY
MLTLKDEVCGSKPKDLLEVMEQAIAAMQTIVTEKLQLFGSDHKAHLHKTLCATEPALSQKH